MTRPTRRLRRDLILSTCLAAAGAWLPAAARAADPQTAATTSSVQQIIVTAERRSVDIQNAALAISAVSARTLDRSFITNVTGLNAIAPSLEVTKSSGFENVVTIRGVGSETPESSLTTTPGVSEFIDGVYIANSISLDQTLFDVSDIQVLRGPQGALYGESSIGGAIIIETNQPRLKTFDASGDFSAGDYNLFRERAEVNLPLGDEFALRVSAQKYDHAGFTTDAAIPGFKLDDAHDVSGKAALLWRPTDDFSATLTAQGYYSNQHGDAQKNILDPSPDPRVVFQDYPAHFSLNNELYHLDLQWDQPWFSIKSVTAYQYLAQVQQEDDTRSTFAQLGYYDDVAAWNTWVNNFTQEVDILSPAGSRLEWTAGLFYLNQTSHQHVVEFAGFPPFPPSLLPTPANLAIPANVMTSPPSNLEYGNDSHATHLSYAAFAQASYHVTPTLTLTAGARINYDRNRDPSQNFAAPQFGGSSFTDFSASDTVPTWRLEADDHLTDDNMIYVSAARGYKPAGVNGKNQIFVSDTFKAETNTAFEVGSKNLFLDRSLRLNIAGFYYLYKNFQFIADDVTPHSGPIANIPSIHDYGAEFEGAYVAADGRLHIDGDLALEKGTVESNFFAIDSTVQAPIVATNPFCTEFGGGGAFFDSRCWAAEIAAARNLKGKQPPAMPNVSGSISASYSFDVLSGTLTPRIQVIYRGSEWGRIFNEPGLDKVPAYTATNLYVEYVPAGGHLRLSIAATNVFDVAGINSRYTDPYGQVQTSDQFIPPRQIIGTIAYRY